MVPFGYYARLSRRDKAIYDRVNDLALSYKDKSVKVDGNHAHIKIGGSSIWVDQGGCWSSKPIQLKADPSSTEILKDPLLERIERLEARIAELEARHGK